MQPMDGGQQFDQQVHQIFSDMDLDRNGAVTKEEQEEYYRRSGANLEDEKVKNFMDEQWAKVDVNNDGSVSYAEFERVALAMDGNGGGEEQGADDDEAKKKKKKRRKKKKKKKYDSGSDSEDEE